MIGNDVAGNMRHLALLAKLIAVEKLVATSYRRNTFFSFR
jgi:hypothetical protein